MSHVDNIKFRKYFITISEQALFHSRFLNIVTRKNTPKWGNFLMSLRKTPFLLKICQRFQKRRFLGEISWNQILLNNSIFVAEINLSLIIFSVLCLIVRMGGRGRGGGGSQISVFGIFQPRKHFIMTHPN